MAMEATDTSQHISHLSMGTAATNTSHHTSHLSMATAETYAPHITPEHGHGGGIRTTHHS